MPDVVKRDKEQLQNGFHAQDLVVQLRLVKSQAQNKSSSIHQLSRKQKQLINSSQIYNKLQLKLVQFRNKLLLVNVTDSELMLSLVMVTDTLVMVSVVQKKLPMLFKRLLTMLRSTLSQSDQVIGVVRSVNHTQLLKNAQVNAVQSASDLSQLQEVQVSLLLPEFKRLLNQLVFKMSSQLNTVIPEQS